MQEKELVGLSDPSRHATACQMDDCVWLLAFPALRLSQNFVSLRAPLATVSIVFQPLVEPDLALLGLLHVWAELFTGQWITKTVFHEWGGCHSFSALVISAAADCPGHQHSVTGLLHIAHRHSIQHMGATFPKVITHLTICECLSSLISWDSLVQDCVFLLNGKQVGIEPIPVRNGFSLVVLPSSQFSDRLCLASLCLPWWRRRMTLNELVLLTVCVHWPHGWPLRGGTTTCYQVSHIEWFDRVVKLFLTVHGRQCRELAPVHRSFGVHHPMHSSGSPFALVVHDSRKTDAVVILVKLLCSVGTKLLAIEVPSVVSTAQLLLTILPAAPEWIGASAIRVFLNGQPLEWQEVRLANGNFVAVHSW